MPIIRVRTLLPAEEGKEINDLLYTLQLNGYVRMNPRDPKMVFVKQRAILFDFDLQLEGDIEFISSRVIQILKELKDIVREKYETIMRDGRWQDIETGVDRLTATIIHNVSFYHQDWLEFYEILKSFVEMIVEMKNEISPVVEILCPTLGDEGNISTIIGLTHLP